LKRTQTRAKRARGIGFCALAVTALAPPIFAAWQAATHGKGIAMRKRKAATPPHEADGWQTLAAHLRGLASGLKDHPTASGDINARRIARLLTLAASICKAGKRA
jgi:hypothetical protein